MKSIGIPGIILCSLLFARLPANAQRIHVGLPQSTPPDRDMHLTVFTEFPKERVTLPHTDTSRAAFFDLYYTRELGDDFTLVGMVIPGKEGDTVYVDLNNDEDLGDDGPPYFFGKDQNALDIDVVAPADPRQRTGLRLERRPQIPDSALGAYVEKNGDLNPRIAKFWGMLTGNPSYTGARGTFYFDSRLCVRRSSLVMGGDTTLIGLLDVGNNGLFNDTNDVLLVDQDRDGFLTYPDDAVGFDDVFSPGGVHLKVSSVDPYGAFLDLTITTEPLTGHFQDRFGREMSRRDTPSRIDTSIWNVTAVTIEGSTVDLRRFKGKPLLLNFWGEWCAPCLVEIPTLIELQRNHAASGLTLVSFLKPANVQKAREIISQKSMGWPQLLLSGELEKQFGIRAYPTNMLILQDGTLYTRTGTITSAFIDGHLR